MTSLSALPLSRHPTVLAALAMVAAFGSTARAQGPVPPADASAPVADAPAVGGDRMLSANLARLAAANAPRPVALGSAKPFADLAMPTHALRDSILVSIARTALGARYARGGQSLRRGFDCSGLVRYVMSSFDVATPRTAAQLAGVGSGLGRDTTRLRPGDLLTFGNRSGTTSHVGIYVGNGRYVHASSVAGRVIESEIGRPRSALVRPWRDTRRVLSHARADSSTQGS